MHKISFLILFALLGCSKKDYGLPPVQVPANAKFHEDLNKAPSNIVGTWRFTVEGSKCGGGFMINAMSNDGMTCRDYIDKEHKQFMDNQKSKAPGLKDTMRFLKAEDCGMDQMPCLYVELATRNLRQVQEDDPFTQGATYLMCKADKVVAVLCLMGEGGDLSDEARSELRAIAETF